MAERRMFAKTIIDSDAFLDMPMSAQLLYFHLSMRADDEGFLNNPKKIQRMIGASDDDLTLLKLKKFLITFDTGVVVIKHWRINNYLQNDRIKATIYQEEKSMLGVKKNKAYTLNFSDPETKRLDEKPISKPKRIQSVSSSDTKCIQKQPNLYTNCIQDVSNTYTEYIQDVYTQESVANNPIAESRINTDGYKMDTECIQDVYSLDTQNSIDKININNINTDVLILSSDNEKSDTETDQSGQYSDFPKMTKQFQEIADQWNTLQEYGITPVRIIGPSTERGRMLRARINQYGFESFKEIVDRIKESDYLQGKINGWQVTFDWVVHPSNYAKVLEGNYKQSFKQQPINGRSRNFVPEINSYSNENFTELEKKLVEN